MSVTTETLGTPEMSTAVRTTTAAGTPATIETITTADVAKVMAEDSLHVFFTSCFSFYTPFQFFLHLRVLAVFANPCLSFYTPFQVFLHLFAVFY
jgi:hypothetical protein